MKMGDAEGAAALVSLLAAARAGRTPSDDASTVPVIVPNTDGDVPDRPRRTAASIGLPRSSASHRGDGPAIGFVRRS